MWSTGRKGQGNQGAKRREKNPVAGGEETRGKDLKSWNPSKIEWNLTNGTPKQVAIELYTLYTQV